jgi:hypothetical protein
MKGKAKFEWEIVDSCEVKTRVEVRHVYIDGVLKEILIREPGNSVWHSPIDLLSRQIDRAVGIIE